MAPLRENRMPCNLSGSRAICNFHLRYHCNASRYQGDLGFGFAIAGKRADAQAILKDLEAKYVRHAAIGLYIAAVYAGLFGYCEQTVRSRISFRMGSVTDPRQLLFFLQNYYYMLQS